MYVWLYDCTGRDAVRIWIAEHRYRGGPDRVVSWRQELRVFRRLSVPVLRPSTAGRDPWTGVETQHHGLCNAVHDPGHERVHRQGTGAVSCVSTEWCCYHTEGTLWNDSRWLSVRLSAACLGLKWQQKDLGSPKLARWKHITQVTHEPI